MSGCIVHSDRGSQFRSRKLITALKYQGLVGSMVRVGAAGNNPAMESFFALLQKSLEKVFLDYSRRPAISNCVVD